MFVPTSHVISVPQELPVHLYRCWLPWPSFRCPRHIWPNLLGHPVAETYYITLCFSMVLFSHASCLPCLYVFGTDQVLLVVNVATQWGAVKIVKNAPNPALAQSRELMKWLKTERQREDEGRRWREKERERRVEREKSREWESERVREPALCDIL